MNNKINVLEILNKDYTDKGGTPEYSSIARRIKSIDKERDMYESVWHNFIEHLPTIDSTILVRYISFAQDAGFNMENLFMHCFNFIQSQWTENNYPSVHAISTRMFLLRDIATHDKSFFTYEWFLENNQHSYGKILDNGTPYNDIVYIYSPKDFCENLVNGIKQDLEQYRHTLENTGFRFLSDNKFELFEKTVAKVSKFFLVAENERLTSYIQVLKNQSKKS